MKLAILAATAATATSVSAVLIAASANDWSKAVDGLRGRLVATMHHDSGQKVQLELELELENVSDIGNPLELAVGGSISSIVDLEVYDGAGKPLPRTAVPGNEIAPLPYALRLPPHSTMHIQLTPAAYEYVPGGKTMLRPFTFQAWDIGPKHPQLFLCATIRPAKADVGASRPWKGPLVLPFIRLP